MLRFDFVSLQLLLFIAETGSVSKAADKASLTPSAVSKRLLELESQLGVVLLDRLPQGARLTPAGQAVIKRVHELLPILGNLHADLQTHVRGDAGKVRLASNTSGIAAGLARELESFKAQHPQVSVSLEELTSAHVVQAVSEGRCDLGVCAATTRLENLASVAYRSTPMALVVPANHPLAKRSAVSYADSLAWPHIGRTQDSALAWFPPGKAPVSEPPIATQVTSFAAVLALVRAGVGIAVIPTEALKDDVLGGIHILELTDPWMVMSLLLVFDPLRIPAPAVTRLRAHLTEATA